MSKRSATITEDLLAPSPILEHALHADEVPENPDLFEADEIIESFVVEPEPVIQLAEDMVPISMIDQIVSDKVASLLAARLAESPVKDITPIGAIARGGPVGAKPTHPKGMEVGYVEKGFTPVTYTCIMNPNARILRDGTIHAIKFAWGRFTAFNSQDAERVEKSGFRVHKDNLPEPEKCPTCGFLSKSSRAIIDHMAVVHPG